MRNVLIALAVWTACVFVFVCAQDAATSTVAATTETSEATSASTNSSGTTASTEPPSPTNSSDTTTASTSPSDTNSSTSQQTTEPAVTTTEAATTTVGPTIPPPQRSSFTVLENGTACLIMEGAFQLMVKYAKTNASEGTAYLNIPPSATTSGSCAADKSSLTVKFTENNADRTITFNFDNVNGVAQLTTWDVMLELDNETFPDHANENLNVTVTQNLLLPEVNLYYMCDAKQSLTDQAALATMMISQLKVQAFSLNDGRFSLRGKDCKADIPYIAQDKTQDTFTVSEGNVTCIVFKAEITFAITYKVNGTDKVKNIYVPPTSNVTQSGSCDSTENTQELTLGFYDDWMLTITFMKDASQVDLAAAADDKFNYHLSDLELQYTLNSNLFPDADLVGQSFTVSKNYSSENLVGSNDGSYMCNADTTLDMGDGVTMTTTNLQYQAFKTTPGDDFGEATDCKVDEETNSIVPIAVGAALAGLVIIVLIAYLIGRRRSRTGYEQV